MIFNLKNDQMKKRSIYLVLALWLVCTTGLMAQADSTQSASSDLANKIQNPIASLISVPFQNNLDFNVGPFDRNRNTLNIQPVVPFSLGEKYNLITRTIIPISSLPVGLDDRSTGIGDINLSLFLTSAKPKKLITGYGVAIGIPTGKSGIGLEKWTAGPSFIALTQQNGWTIGALVQNTWDFAGSDDVVSDVNFFYSQIFVVKNLQKGWYVNTAPIITSDWEAASDNRWTVPLGGGFGKLTRLGKLPVNAQIGYYFNVIKPDFGASSQFRFQVVFLFPK